MFNWIQQLLASKTLAPHGFCLLWRPELIWTHVIADALIAIAYFSIPLALGFFLTKRRDVQFGWVLWLFVAFIMLCGVTHVFAIWTLWVPVYGIEAIVKAITAVASVFTAIALWPLLPKALAVPSPAQLAAANASLAERVHERDQALAALERETVERLKAEEMLHHAQKMEAVGQLTGGVAHDFNNLMTAVLGNLDRVDRRLPGESDDLRQSLRGAIAAAERAAKLTHQLLAFSRRQPLQPAAEDINALVANALSLTEGSLGPGIETSLALGADLPTVWVDSVQTENAIVNLIMNARDAMPDGGQLTLATKVEDIAEGGAVPSGRYVLVEVRDSGSGMSEETIARAFEPFFTTKPLGEGTGLGLSQVYGFVNQSGGHVLLESRAGEGVVVQIYLPVESGA
jgi:signal transduction histidine kinase